MGSWSGGGWDFIEWLGPDASTAVFSLLDDPKDLVRGSAVSRSWHNFVISNAFCKKLCLKLCPELSNCTCVMEVSSFRGTDEVGCSTTVEWGTLNREHRVYSYLGHCICSPSKHEVCILEAISASSTDNFPDESIDNTLQPRDRVEMRPSYWSSAGEKDPSVPETLTYRLLSSRVCLVDELRVQPFQAYFQYGYPIYSANAVRFRMGYSRWHENRCSEATGVEESVRYRDSNTDYVWTYVSPEYSMLQENKLQTFKLPHPVICIGGIVQIELLQRVQRQEMDGLYYICICHAQVIGRPLSPSFGFDVLEPAKSLVLKYNPETKSCPVSQKESRKKLVESSAWHAFAARVRQLGAGRRWNPVLLNALLGTIPVGDFGIDDSSDEEADQQ